MIIQTILGHKVAAIGAALILGTTTAAAATGTVPFVQDEDPAVDVEAIVEEETEETESETGGDGEGDTGSEEAPAEDATDEGDDAAGEESPAEEEGSGDEDGEDDGDADAKDEVLPPVNEDEGPYLPELCEEAENHGEYVSGVARDDSIEGNRGEIVSQEARGTCGKGAEETETPETDVEEDDDAEDEADDKVDDADDDADDGERAERGNGNKSNGNNGNGNGQGRGNNKKND